MADSTIKEERNERKVDRGKQGGSANKRRTRGVRGHGKGCHNGMRESERHDHVTARANQGWSGFHEVALTGQI